MRRDGCTPWQDKFLKMINIYMRCDAIKNRCLLIGRHLEIYLNADFMQTFSVLLYTFFILNCLLPRIFNHKCFYPMLLMSYWSKSHRASHRHVDATILKAFQQDIGTKITFFSNIFLLVNFICIFNFFSPGGRNRLRLLPK